MTLFLVLLLSIPLSSCVTRNQIDALVWLNNMPLPADVCALNPVLNNYGFYRRLNDGHLEFISACNQSALAPHMVSMKDTDYEMLLDQLNKPLKPKTQTYSPESHDAP